MPGHRWDPEKKRFFRILPGPTTSTSGSSSGAQGSGSRHRGSKQRKTEKQKKEPPRPPLPPLPLPPRVRTSVGVPSTKRMGSCGTASASTELGSRNTAARIPAGRSCLLAVSADPSLAAFQVVPATVHHCVHVHRATFEYSAREQHKLRPRRRLGNTAIFAQVRACLRPEWLWARPRLARPLAKLLRSIQRRRIEPC